MKPHDNLLLHRTVGDTDPFLLQLLKRTDAEPTGEPVPDTAVVAMHVHNGTNVITLEGTAFGSEDGKFSFPTTDIAEVKAARLNYEIEVSDDGVEYTIANGMIQQRNQIA
jgi:hypothetical protein